MPYSQVTPIGVARCDSLNCTPKNSETNFFPVSGGHDRKIIYTFAPNLCVHGGTFLRKLQRVLGKLPRALRKLPRALRKLPRALRKPPRALRKPPRALRKLRGRVGKFSTVMQTDSSTADCISTGIINYEL
jgi:hypothetical protein